jgi:hypothetical protein
MGSRSRASTLPFGFVSVAVDGHEACGVGSFRCSLTDEATHMEERNAKNEREEAAADVELASAGD